MHTYLKSRKLSGQRHLSNEVTEVHLPSLKIDRVSFLSVTSNPHAIFFLAWSSLSYWMTPAVKALCIVGPFSLDSPHIYWRGHMYHLHEHLSVQGKILAAEKIAMVFTFVSAVCIILFTLVGSVLGIYLVPARLTVGVWEVTVFMFKPIWDVSSVNCLETAY